MSVSGRLFSVSADCMRRFADMIPFRRHAAIFMYHSVSFSPAFWAVCPAEFEWQMRYLRDRGYRVIPLAELVACAMRGDNAPRRSIVLTFDDGYEDNYSSVFPVLRRYGYPATVFLTTGLIGRKDVHVRGGALMPMLDASQIREMSDSGLVDFGAHTRTHPRLPRISLPAAEGEMRESRDAVLRLTGVVPAHFAYPYGDHSPAVVSAAAGLFAAAVTVRPGSVPRRPDPFLLPRQAVDSSVTRFRFRLKLPI